MWNDTTRTPLGLSVVALVAFAAPSLNAEDKPAASLVFPDEKIDHWQGDTRHTFKVAGRNAWVVEPKTYP